MYLLSALSEEHAKEICDWEYKEEYRIYNTNWATVQVQKWAIADELKRKLQFSAVLDDNNALCGYFRFVEENDRVMLGLGLDPQICGKGIGTELMKLILNEFYHRYPGHTLELEVRDFNQRAIKCYSHAGFHVVDSYSKDTLIGAGNFLLMRYVKPASQIER
jgi:[ribosomal protein S18]-alanine N-acetyltransferase